MKNPEKYQQMIQKIDVFKNEIKKFAEEESDPFTMALSASLCVYLGLMETQDYQDLIELSKILKQWLTEKQMKGSTEFLQ